MALPAAVAALAGGAPCTPVWVNELGGVTCEVAHASGRRFIKWAPAGGRIDLRAEAARLRWAAAYAPVPTVLDEGSDADGHWIVTAALPGRMAIAERWKREPRTAVIAIGEALRALHEALPVVGCPFTWRAAERVDRARCCVSVTDRATWHSDHQRLTTEQAIRLLAQPPTVDKEVVCHGDTCAPNTLLSDDGRWSGHVDLGALGIADRWADLAIATWSTTWNYAGDWEGLLLDAYGVEPDPERTRYYRLLWDLDPG